MGVTFVASHQPVIEIPFGVPDYVAHATSYAILGALLLRALAGGSLRSMQTHLILSAVVIGTAYGLSDELHQWFVPGRTASVSDLVADGVGSLVGASAAALIGALMRRYNRGDVL